MALRLVIVALSVLSVINESNAATCFIPAPGLSPEIAKALLAYAKPTQQVIAPPAAHVKPPFGLPVFPKRQLALPNAIRKVYSQAPAPVPTLTPALANAAPAPISAQTSGIPPALLQALISSLANQHAPAAPSVVCPMEVPAPTTTPPPTVPPPPAPAPAGDPSAPNLPLDPALLQALLKSIVLSPPEVCPCASG